MATVGNSFPIWVPDSNTDLVPIAAPFTNLANSVSDQLDRIWNKHKSQVVHTDAITAGTGWTLTYQRVVVIAEILLQVYATWKRTGAAISVGTSGDITNQLLGSWDSGYNTQAMQPLSSGQDGRGAFGHTTNAGQIYLDSVTGTVNIPTNALISLGGLYALDNPIPSGL